MAKLTVADLELLFSANTTDVEKAEKQVLAIGKKIESKPIKVDADPKAALASMDRVETAAKKLVSADTALKLDADISRAEKGLERTKQRLEDLQVRALGGLDVTADVKRAQTQLQKTERQLKALTDAKQMIEVDANTEPSENAFRRVRKSAGEAGEDSGEAFGKNIIAALVSIPIAGAVVGIGVAAGKALVGAFNDGLQVDARQDRLQALTGITEGAALRLGRAAGEAYANNFGESIESNMDATRLGLQFRIIDPKATTRDAQLVVQGLAGIADVLGEDVEPVARAVTQMLRTGLAKSAQDAFDILATGAREGVNISEDLLDTFNEYGTQFRKLGLDGPQALGLISQGLRAGARDSDVAADALKEFAIRAVDPAMKQGFEDVGFSWEDLSRRISEGGPVAAAALDETLDKIRQMPEPAEKAAAAAALFGTQSEDMAAALLAMDLTTAVDQLNGVTGSAQRMFDTLASNDASKVAQAQRNIEVAADGIKGALAGAFSEPLGDFADWVSQNRGPLLQFFSDLINGAIDFGITASDSFGAFVSGPLATMIDGLKRVMQVVTPWADVSALDDFIDGMRDFDSQTDKISDGLESAREKFNGFADGQISLGYLNDASLRTVDSIAKVGLAADGTKLSLAGIDTANLSASASGRKLQEQLGAAASALDEEMEAAWKTGEGQENLTDRYNTTRDALIDQMVAMDMTRDEAEKLIDTVLKTPEEASTTYSSNAETERARAQALADRIDTLPDGRIRVYSNTTAAKEGLDDFILKNDNREIRIRVIAKGAGIKMGSFTVTPEMHDGGIVQKMAAGGIPGTTPMQNVAQMVSPNTWRIVGDRRDVDEAYIPLDGSPRSMGILFETMRRMGIMPMADGGIVTSARGKSPASVDVGGIHVHGSGLTAPEVRSLLREEVRSILGSALGR